MRAGAAQRTGLVWCEPGAILRKIGNLLLQRADFIDIIQLLFLAFPSFAQAV